MAGILLKIVAPRQLVRGAGVPRADVGDEILLVESEAVLQAVNHPPLDRHGVIRIISVLGVVPGALRAAAPAALIWITVERGLAPDLLNSVVGATSPGAAARVAAYPRQHAAAAAVSDARRVVLLSQGAQFTFLVPGGRVDAALAPGTAYTLPQSAPQQHGISLTCPVAKVAIWCFTHSLWASYPRQQIGHLKAKTGPPPPGRAPSILKTQCLQTTC